MNNYNIVKYTVKYFVVSFVCAYGYNISANLINKKSDFENFIGTSLLIGLFIGLVLVLKSDLTKLYNNKTKTKKTDE